MKDGKRVILDYILNEKHIKKKHLDVTFLMGTAGGMFDHYLVEAR